MNYHIDRSLLGLEIAAHAPSREGGQAASPAQREVLREHAKQIRSGRSLRHEWFDRNIFGEPAWEMLLVLYVIDGEQRRLSTRQVAKLASLSLTTTLRWLDFLEEQNLVSRRPNPFDQRVVDTQLSDKGRMAMDGYLLRNCGAELLDRWKMAGARP